MSADVEAVDILYMSYNNSENVTSEYYEYEYEYYDYYEYTEMELACSNLQIPALFCEYSNFVVVCFGFIYPIFALLTTIANIFTVRIFTRYSSSATWIFLTAIALADIMTAVPPSPHYVYLYMLGHFRNLMPFAWCSTYFIVVELLPLWFHTASILLTVLMCIQRYICVCHPFTANLVYSTRRTILMVIGVFFVAAITHFHLLIFMENKTEEISVIPLDQNSTNIVTVCSWLPHIGKTHGTIHNFIYIVLVELLPCVIITILTVKIIIKLRESRKFREKSLQTDVEIHQQRAQARQTTVMLVGIMVIFLITEVPFVIFLVLVTVKKYNDGFMTNDKLYIMVTFQSILVLLNCHLNFWIYCTMSKNFRDGIKKIFLCQKQDDIEPQTISTTAE